MFLLACLLTHFSTEIAPELLRGIIGQQLGHILSQQERTKTKQTQPNPRIDNEVIIARRRLSLISLQENNGCLIPRTKSTRLFAFTERPPSIYHIALSHEKVDASVMQDLKILLL